MNAEAVKPRLRGFACANARLTDLADARLLMPSDLSSAGSIPALRHWSNRSLTLTGSLLRPHGQRGRRLRPACGSPTIGMLLARGRRDRSEPSLIAVPSTPFWLRDARRRNGWTIPRADGSTRILYSSGPSPDARRSRRSMLSPPFRGVSGPTRPSAIVRSTPRSAPAPRNVPRRGSLCRHA